MLSQQAAAELLRKYGKDLENLQKITINTSLGFRSDSQFIPDLLKALDCIANGKTYEPTSHMTGMSSIGKVTNDPQKAVGDLGAFFDDKFIETYFGSTNKATIERAVHGVDLDKLKANILQFCKEIKPPTVTEKNDTVQKSRAIALTMGAHVEFRVKGFKHNNPEHNARQPLDTVQFEFRTTSERDTFYERIRSISPSDVSKDVTATKKDSYGNAIPIVLVKPEAIKSIDVVLFPRDTKLSQTEFIETTRSLINAGIFAGRSSRLEESLKTICDALETGNLIDGSQISAQVSGGWMASGQQKTLSGMISVDEAWTFLFQQMGELDNSQYKEAIRDRLEKHFSTQKYPIEVRHLWFETFSDQEGYKKDSKYSNVENFVSGRPEHQVSVGQPRTETHHSNLRQPRTETPHSTSKHPGATVHHHPTVKQPSPPVHQSTSVDTHKAFIQHFIQHHASGVERLPLVEKGGVKIEFKNKNFLDNFKALYGQYMSGAKEHPGHAGKVYLTVPIVQIEKMENGLLKGKYQHYVTSNKENRDVASVATCDTLKEQSIKDKYQQCRGDFLKSTILKDFYEDLENAGTPKAVNEVIERYKRDGRYDTLAKAQNTTMQVLGMTTSSAQAFEKMIAERLDDIGKEQRAIAS
ncbi:hypothetical protein [Legionella parisiensis]|uniref:Multifunctional virulence effector protein DrrA n=1 Tax=Legionella parisiensis TaxID=45071 RepID=A0A1E5JTZ9_9GAMM|nr:hypothetical protein [Legionella parisiensis]KTD43095.1 multifunctional virulence effector protein DrrA [Legionella parisiensis]OEH47975.1 Multifunctional virulence effector protein DrrA [Legionella parisiensis]STX77826.1 substrate of the Dot/Icm secretion system [Legionella parisiensis]